MSLCYKDRTWCTSPCATVPCDRRLTQEVREAARAWGESLGLDYGPLSYMPLNCADYTPDQSPTGRLRRALSDAMEEAELFGDLSAADREFATAWLDFMPPQTVAAIGRAFAKAAKETNPC